MIDNAFTGAALDRAGDARRRDPEWLAIQRAHPGARAMVAGTGGVRVDGPGSSACRSTTLNGAEPLLLGARRPRARCSPSTRTRRATGVAPLIGAGGVRGEPPVGLGGPRSACARPRRSSRRPTAVWPPTPRRC